MQNAQRVRAEKTQAGNPHRLTINQHIFPRASMNRFARADGTVHVRRLEHADDIVFRTDNPYFCARRVWDHRTEHGLMYEIESRFQNVADQITAGSVRTLSDQMNEAVTDLYLLWQLRFNRFMNPIGDVRLNIIRPERELDKDSQEILESKGIIFIRPDCMVPGRMMAGMGMTIGMDRERLRMRGTKWGIQTAEDAEFIVPDNFLKYSVLPLSPTICLASEMPDQRLGIGDVAMINRLAIESSRHYYFARDLTQCPALRPIPLHLGEAIREGNFGRKF